MRTCSALCLALFLLLQGCSRNSEQKLPQHNPHVGSDREIAYTDKGDAFWVTRSGGYHSSAWHGLHAARRHYFEDVYIHANGTLLPRAEAQVTINPFELKRDYPELGISETWTLLDNSRTLLIELEADYATHWTVQPAILGGHAETDFDLVYTPELLRAKIHSMERMEGAYPELQMWFSHPMTWSESMTLDLNTYSAFLTKRADYDASHRLTMAVSVGPDFPQIAANPVWLESARSERQNRLSGLISSTRVRSSREDLEIAIPWAHASLDALIMDQQGIGIYAGLPWFSDYWGRDTFISFSGAALVSGQFDVARKILLSFAELQNTDPGDRNYGRVPNRARPDEVIYNTTDGTPWFVRSIWDYYRYSGDEEFLSQLWPAIQHATQGALKNWVDRETGLLLHDDADTWMDAKTLEGAWSPRGDRAIEIQFIWRDQLEITRTLAAKFGDDDLEQACLTMLTNLKSGLESFRAGKTGHFVDHLNSDGSQDKQVRPNVFLVPPLFQETSDWITFQKLAPQLLTPVGALSLSQEDENFHPYHHLKGKYVQDAAYHNGIIWTWNSAAMLTQATQFHQYHYVSRIFNDLTKQILERGAIGTIAELTDAWPRDGEYRLSGTFSQAWSLAEYLRVFYQDVLGVVPDMTRSAVNLSPRLLPGMESVEFHSHIGRDQWQISYADAEDGLVIHILRHEAIPVDLTLSALFKSTEHELTFQWTTTDMHLRFEKNMAQWTVPASAGEYNMSSSAVEHPINGLPFCEVNASIAVPALEGPPYRSLSKQEVIYSGSKGEPLLDIADPENDDRGENGAYEYPTNAQFSDGVADILNFELSRVEGGYLFEFEFADLVDPGWHPEYGFQLSFGALGISFSKDTGTPTIARNAKADFKAGFRADRIIYFSSGLIITDAENQPIAEYLPSERGGAIGNAQSNRVQFRLPLDIFPPGLEDAQFQLAVGCQDDHGGAVIGDFREVEATAAEWVGGGALEFSSNVYDWLGE